MPERELGQQPHPEETSIEHDQFAEERTGGGGHSPELISPPAEEQTVQSGPKPDAASPIELQILEPVSLQRVTPEAQLPTIAPPPAVEPMLLPDFEPIALQIVGLDSHAPEIIQGPEAAALLYFPPSFPRPSIQPIKLSQSLPETQQYTFIPAMLPFPISAPVRLVPRRMSQVLPAPVQTPVTQPSRMVEQVDRPDMEEDEGEGTGIGSSVAGLMDLFFEVPGGASTTSGLLSSGRPWVILAEEAPEEERYEGFLLYLLAQVLRCTSGAPRVQVPSRVSLEEWTMLADRRVTFIPAGRSRSLDKVRLFEQLHGLIGSGHSFVVIGGGPHTLEQLADELINALPVGVSLSHLRLRRSDKDTLIDSLRVAFAYLDAFVLPGESIDIVAAALEDQLDRLLVHYVERVNPLLRRRSAGGTESEEHYRTKLYVGWLYRNHGDSVKTEHPLAPPSAVADVLIEDEGLCYEVETLYGTGDPITKLNETVEKYQKHQGISHTDVRIVIPNFTALLYLRHLLRFEREVAIRDQRFSIWTPNLRKVNAHEGEGLSRLRGTANGLREAWQ